MIRGLLSGLVLGGVFAGAILVVTSLLLPPPVPVAAEGDGAAVDGAASESVAPAAPPARNAAPDRPASQPPVDGEAVKQTEPTAEVPAEPPADSGATPMAETTPAPTPDRVAGQAMQPSASPSPEPARPAPAPLAAPAPMPEAAPRLEAPRPEAAARPPVPETAMVEVPPGSEFGRGGADRQPVLPDAGESAPALGGAAPVAPPAADAAPDLPEVETAAAPVIAPEPAAPAAPAEALPPPARPAPETTVEAPAPPAQAPPAQAQPAQAAPPQAPPPPAALSPAPADPLRDAGARPAAATEAEAALPDLATAPEAPVQAGPADDPQAPPAAVSPQAEASSAAEASARAAPEAPEILASRPPSVLDSLPQPAAGPPRGLEAPDRALPVSDDGTARASLPRGLPQIEAGSAETSPEPAADPGAPPRVGDAGPSLPMVPDAPQPGFGQAEGVRVNRLPQLGTAPEAPAATEAGPGDAAPPGALRHARAFTAPEGADLLGLVLIDLPEGAGGMSPAEIAALDLPVAVALDPLAPGAAARAAALRAAGVEIGLLAASVPEGAQPADLAVNFAAWTAALPEAALIVEAPSPGFQNSRALAQLMVGLAGDGGFGLITHDEGLNIADQLAAAAGVPRAESFGILDTGQETPAALRRTLDRAAFEATRSGRVLIAAAARAETIAVIADWLKTTRRDLAPAPASAVLEGR